MATLMQQTGDGRYRTMSEAPYAAETDLQALLADHPHLLDMLGESDGHALSAPAVTPIFYRCDSGLKLNALSPNFAATRDLN